MRKASGRPIGSKRGSFRTRYLVDGVPGVWKPLFWWYSYSVAVVLFLYFIMVRATSRVAICGKKHLDRNKYYLFACWHDEFPIYLATWPRHTGHVWMVLPAWYMKPMHLVALWSGVAELVYGGTGFDGVEAARKLVTRITQGHSTVFLPDGPFCNPRELRKGILHMALESNALIAPMKLQASCVLRLRTWDRKVVPLPFSRITIEYGTPIRVTEVNKEAMEVLRSALNGENSDYGGFERLSSEQNR